MREDLVEMGEAVGGEIIKVKEVAIFPDWRMLT